MRVLVVRLLLLLLLAGARIAWAGESTALALQPQAVASFDVQIDEPNSYSVRVNFYIKEPSKYGAFFDRQSPEDAGRLSTLLKLGEGVPARFRVQVLQASDSRVVLDETVARPDTNARYMGRYAILATKSLAPGKYNVRVDVLDCAADLAPLRAQVELNRTHHGK